MNEKKKANLLFVATESKEIVCVCVWLHFSIRDYKKSKRSKSSF